MGSWLVNNVRADHLLPLWPNHNQFFWMPLLPRRKEGVVGCWISLPGGRHKVPETTQLEQQKRTFSQFWRLEVCDQGAGRGLSPWLADGRLLPISSHVCVLISPSWKDTSHVR